MRKTEFWYQSWEDAADVCIDDILDEFMDKCMEVLLDEIEAALKGYEDSDFVKNFWGAGEKSEK